jgi:hypothetical protein
VCILRTYTSSSHYLTVLRCDIAAIAASDVHFFAPGRRPRPPVMDSSSLIMLEIKLPLSLSLPGAALDPPVMDSS